MKEVEPPGEDLEQRERDDLIRCVEQLGFVVIEKEESTALRAAAARWERVEPLLRELMDCVGLEKFVDALDAIGRELNQ